jgi:hypothetical protein
VHDVADKHRWKVAIMWLAVRQRLHRALRLATVVQGIINQSTVVQGMCKTTAGSCSSVRTLSAKTVHDVSSWPVRGLRLAVTVCQVMFLKILSVPCLTTALRELSTNAYELIGHRNSLLVATRTLADHRNAFNPSLHATSVSKTDP